MEDSMKCKRCGTCCRKGGPTLHSSDIGLIHSGCLLPRHLVTVRAGELVYHPLKRSLMVLPKELVKLRGRYGSWACIFYDESEGCTIYESRPIECRVLTCWDEGPIAGLFLQDLLARESLIPTGSILFEIMEAYDRAFPTRTVLDLLRSLAEPSHPPSISAELERLSRADETFRQTAVSSLGIPEDSLPFFFGRPIAEILAQFAKGPAGEKQPRDRPEKTGSSSFRVEFDRFPARSCIPPRHSGGGRNPV